MKSLIEMNEVERKLLIKQIVMERLRNNTLRETLKLNSRPNCSGWRKWGRYMWLLKDDKTREELEKQTYDVIDYLDTMFFPHILDKALKDGKS